MSRFFRNKKLFINIAFVFIFGLGAVFGWYIHQDFHVSANVQSDAIRQNSPDYHYINPLLLADDINSEPSPIYSELHETLASYINQTVSEKNAENVSVYFRDMNSGQWTGVNENDIYAPASMLKIATLIAVLRYGEADPSLYSQKAIMSSQSADLNIGQFYPPQHPIIPGKSYTVQDLLTSMIVDSDNNAQALLVDLIGKSSFQKVLTDLQLPMESSGSVDFMSPQLYSRFYRILYNSTYLSNNLSEKALQFLIQKDFAGGLYAGVPDGVAVAQKFGERTITDTSGNPIERELHDCGIVYYSNKPYFLCVMTRGKDFTKLQPIIADISKLTWNQISLMNEKK